MKIRIAVAVAKDGSWRAEGWPTEEDDVLSEQSIEFISEHVHEQGIQYHVVFVEADVPLPPSPQVVQGTTEVPPCK